MTAATGTPSGGSPRDPSALEQEASAIRADMDRTLDALERRFSPGQIMDRSLGYLREHGPELTHKVGDTVKQNPVPVLMTAAGIAWLITSSLGPKRQQSSYATASDQENQPDSEYSSGAESSSEDLSGKLHGRMAATRERVAATRERVRASAADKVSHARQAAADKASHAMESARARSQTVQRRVRSMADEQPLVLGALAVAIGALIGAALPSTQYEDEKLGQVRDRALAKAKEAGERQYENVRDKLDENVRSKLESRGEGQISHH